MRSAQKASEVALLTLMLHSGFLWDPCKFKSCSLPLLKTISCRGISSWLQCTNTSIRTGQEEYEMSACTQPKTCIWTDCGVQFCETSSPYIQRLKITNKDSIPWLYAPDGSLFNELEEEEGTAKNWRQIQSGAWNDKMVASFKIRRTEHRHLSSNNFF